MAESYGKKGKEIVGCDDGATRQGDCKQTNYTNCTQNQSLSYLGKAFNRDPRTIQIQNKKMVLSESQRKMAIIVANTPDDSKTKFTCSYSTKLTIGESVVNVKSSTLELLTESGWSHLHSKDYSKLIAFTDQYHANKELAYLKANCPELVAGCFVACFSQTYYIGRKATNRFKFEGLSKLDRKVFRVKKKD